MKRDIDAYIDNLLSKNSVSVSADFTEQTLNKLSNAKSCNLDSRIDALLKRQIVFKSINFAERVISATIGTRKKLAKRLYIVLSSATFVAAACAALMFTNALNTQTRIPNTSDYEKMCSIEDDINGIACLVLEEERFDMLRF